MSTLLESCCDNKAEQVTSRIRPRDRGPAPCLACGASGMAVEHRTLLHMLPPDRVGRLGDREYRFCEAPGCDTVYFSVEGEVSFGTADLRERVGLKATGDPEAPVCYCFGFTVGDLEADVRVGRTPTAAGRIREMVKARLCACEVRNPSGRCCLGEIARIENLLQPTDSPYSIDHGRSDHLVKEEL